MSAIFGVINKKENTVEPHIISDVQETLRHRTADGSHTWLNDSVFFWHGKLYTHPQQQNEILPFQKDDLVIVADALLFNRDDLFNLLFIHKEITFSDSQLILAAYQKWGKNCVHHLDGEYVFAIWNKQNKELFLVSDPIGFRPVFYYDSDDCFIFCSEIKGVVAAKQTPNYFNEEHIIEYHFRQSPPNQTYNKEVFALCGGNTLTLSDNKINIEKYWIPQPLGKYHFTKPEEWFECLKDLLFKAVEKRLNPDVPVGITLSGGLDSSSIACILSDLLKKKNKPLYAFSSVLPVDHKGIEQDERKYIEIVNKHCGNIIQTYVEAPGVGPFDGVKEAFFTDEEIPNAFHYMDRAIREAAKEKNTRMLFSGFGGDFWASWKCRGLIFEIVRQKKFYSAYKILKQLSQVENKSFLFLFRSEILSNTQFYNFIKQVIKRKGKRINFSCLKEDFIKKFPYLNQTPQQFYDQFMRIFIERGEVGRIVSMLKTQNAFYNICSFDPMLDKDVLDFLINVPSIMFIHNGYRRALLRYGFEKVLPKEISWRQNKISYNPDYDKRVIDNKSKIIDFINSPDWDFIFENYFDKERSLKLLNSIKRQHAIMTAGLNPSGVMVANMTTTMLMLSQLKKAEYQFR